MHSHLKFGQFVFFTAKYINKESYRNWVNRIGQQAFNFSLFFTFQWNHVRKIMETAPKSARRKTRKLSVNVSQDLLSWKTELNVKKVSGFFSYKVFCIFLSKWIKSRSSFTHFVGTVYYTFFRLDLQIWFKRFRFV